VSDLAGRARRPLPIRTRGHGPVHSVAAATVAVVALALAAGAGCTDTASDPSAARGPNATVVRIVDGDTIVARVDGTDERVRMIGIDTPESVKQDSPVECFGPEASQHLKELIPPGTAVRLELDVEPRDKYDRLLAYVFRGDDELFVNRTMVADGYAESFVYKPNVAFTPTLQEASRAAKSSGAGLWTACAADPPFRR
jgi:micrococcal nuclease